MNLLLLEAGELGDSGEVELTDHRARHLVEVLAVAVGGRVRIGVIGGGHGSAEVVAVAEGRVGLRLRLDQPPSPPPPVSLILALPRPKVVARVIESAAAIGVRRIDLTNAWRVDKSYFHSHRVTPSNLRAAAVRGCEQGGTTWLPEVALHRRLMELLAGLEPVDTWERRLVAHPRAPASLENHVAPGEAATVILAVGPEGGWIERELESFSRLGFVPVTIGTAILRVETAVVALLSELALLRRL